jgi:hypothetical protein
LLSNRSESDTDRRVLQRQSAFIPVARPEQRLDRMRRLAIVQYARDSENRSAEAL